MNTTLAAQQTNMDEQSLILPNKREALLMKLSKFKVNALNLREQEDLKRLTRITTTLFLKLCKSKFGVSWDQIQILKQEEINELAVIIHQQSRATALINTGILACIPVIGWIVLLISLKLVKIADSDLWRNMRYYWWYKKIKSKYSQDFKPIIKSNN